MTVRSTNSIPISAYYADRGDYLGPYVEYERLIVNGLTPGRKFLDVGCGRKFPMAQKWLATGAEVFGLDPVIDHESLPAGIEGVQGEVENIPYDDGVFDLIASCAVLEHLEYPQIAFKEVSRLLKPQGRAVFLTPSKYDYVSLAARLIPNRFHGKLVNATEGRSEEDTFPTFYRANSRKQVRTLASESGLSLKQAHYLDQSPYSLKFNKTLFWIGCRYHHLLRSHNTFSFLRGWLLCELEKPAN